MGIEKVKKMLHTNKVTKQEAFDLKNPFYDIFDYVQKSPSTAMLSEVELLAIYQTVLMTNRLPGELAECGAYQGGTSYFIANAMNKNKNLHLFESFQGAPYSDLQEDISCPEAHNKTSRRYIDELFKQYNRRRPYHVIIHDGWFKDTLSEVEDKEFCLAFVDINQYQSTKECIEFFWPRIVKEGWMIIDDYYCERHIGVNKAVDEYFGQRTLQRHPNTYSLEKLLFLRKE